MGSKDGSRHTGASQGVFGLNEGSRYGSNTGNRPDGEFLRRWKEQAFASKYKRERAKRRRLKMGRGKGEDPEGPFKPSVEQKFKQIDKMLRTFTKVEQRKKLLQALEKQQRGELGGDGYTKKSQNSQKTGIYDFIKNADPIELSFGTKPAKLLKTNQESKKLVLKPQKVSKNAQNVQIEEIKKSENLAKKPPRKLPEFIYEADYENRMRPRGKLLLPNSFIKLFKKFTNLDKIIHQFEKQHLPTFLPVINKELNRICSLKLSLDDLAHIRFLYPKSFKFEWATNPHNCERTDLRIRFRGKAVTSKSVERSVRERIGVQTDSRGKGAFGRSESMSRLEKRAIFQRRVGKELGAVVLGERSDVMHARLLKCARFEEDCLRRVKRSSGDVFRAYSRLRVGILRKAGLPDKPKISVSKNFHPTIFTFSWLGLAERMLLSPDWMVWSGICLI